MASEYIERVVKVAIVHTPDQALYAEGLFEVEIIDEGAGEFLEVTQLDADEKRTVRIDANDWPVLREAIESMLSKCRSE